MNSKPSILPRLILTLCLVMLSSALRADEQRPKNLPDGYRFIGNYKLNSKMMVERGDTMPVTISPLLYSVYSDGIAVRVYCIAAGDESYSTYDIYRSDGVGVARKSGEIDIVAGVQGFSTKGDMVRQISVTRKSLTLVKMPPRSHHVLITRAIAIKALPATPSAKQPAIPRR